jgi:hypothetical protein
MIVAQRRIIVFFLEEKTRSRFLEKRKPKITENGNFLAQ